MRNLNLLYWITTGLFSAMMAMSAIAYLAAPQAAAAFAALGFPGYFRIELAIFKLLGAAALLLPMAGGRIKEWAYAGFAIVVISALVAHAAIGDGALEWGGTVVAMGILVASYMAYHQKKKVSAA